MSEPSEAAWHLYLIETASGALYTGITTDVQRRLGEHSAGRGAKALRGKGPLSLVHHEEVGTRSDALKLEAAVKRLPAVKKRRWFALRSV